MVDRDISDYWKQKTEEVGRSELSESGKLKVGNALAEMDAGQSKEFDNVDDLINDLNQ